jgi:hypothetical protein
MLCFAPCRRRREMNDAFRWIPSNRPDTAFWLAAAHRKRYKGDISSTDLLSSRGTSLCLETGHDGYVPPEQMQVTCNLFGAPAG